MAYLHTAPAPADGPAGPAARLAALVRGNPVPPPMLVLFGMLSTQLGAAVAKTLFGVAGPLGITLVRLGFAALLLLAVVRPSVRLPRRDLVLVAGFGTALAGMNLCFYSSMSRIPLGVAVTIGFLGPLAVSLATSRRWLHAGWGLLAAGGVALLGGVGGPLDRLGLLLAMGIAVCWALYVVLGAAVSQRVPGGGGLALGMTVAAVCAMPLGLAENPYVLLDPVLLGPGLLVAAMSSVVPYSLEMRALRRMPARVFAVLLSLEPAIGALVGLLVLGEWLSWPQALGVALVVAASVGATRTRDT